VRRVHRIALPPRVAVGLAVLIVLGLALFITVVVGGFDGPAAAAAREERGSGRRADARTLVRR